MHELKFMFSIKNIFLVQIITVSYDTFPGCYYFLYRQNFFFRKIHESD